MRIVLFQLAVSRPSPPGAAPEDPADGATGQRPSMLFREGMTTGSEQKKT